MNEGWLIFAKADVGSAPLTFNTVPTRFRDKLACELQATLDRMGVDAPIIITDEGIEDSGILDAVVGSLEEYELYYATWEPTTNTAKT